jgi:hypothetical protein
VYWWVQLPSKSPKALIILDSRLDGKSFKKNF